MKKPLYLFLGLGALVLLVLACSFPPYAVDWLKEPGAVLYQDDFSDPTSGWTHLSNQDGVMDYDAGGYRFLINSPDYDLWSLPQLAYNYQDVRLEVDAARLAGPVENRIGLICRYQDASDYYFFVVSSDGYYGIGKVVAGELSLIGQDQMQYSFTIQQGTALNHLRADCVGDMLIFYINNDVPVAAVRDSDLKMGRVGLLAGSFQETGVDVVFDNFVVLKP
jgi:hypothetical protein